MSRNQSQIPSKMEHESAALAAELFDHFSSATTMRQILGLYHSMCDTVSLRPAPINEFYPKLKSKIRSWKAQALWKKFDARLSHKVYNKGLACNGTRVLVIGAGPCGLRTAIEAQLLGAKVVLIEKRDRFSRNNVLHLWPFLITDLRNLGAKKFYGKFCAGSIDHISIRQLQCILLKVALLLGVEVHDGISFLKILEPKDGCGWRADISPADHAVSHYEFNVMVGADGKRNTLEGFRRKEFRGRLAIAITANFINKKTWAEAKVEEISGVAFIFNQAFFKELYETTGIDLENIVYYKDETHYFVMTAKKHSLIDKGVIIQDFSDPAELLAPANVNTEALLAYAKEAAEFSTKHQMPNLEFAVNHYGKPDVAMFDFTSMFAAETSCCAVVKKNYRLLQCLVGDSLLEPFWPTGSGCARGFLSSMDAAYAMKLWSNQRNSILAVLAQRESIYRLLAQTTPENLHRDIGSYTVEPASRYPNLNKTAVGPHQVKHLLETDDPTLLEQTFVDSNALTAVPETLVRRKRRTGDVAPISAVLLRWIKSQLSSYEFLTNLENAAECFTNGQVFCCLINRYRPDLIDLTKLKGLNVEQCNEIAFSVIESEMGIPKALTAAESVTLQDVDPKVWLNYLEQVCEVFRGEIPHVKHPKLDLEKLRETKREIAAPDFSNLLKLKSQSKDANERPSDEPDRERPRRSRRFDNSALSTPRATPDAPSRRSRKRRSYDKFGNIEERAKRLQEIEANRNERQSKRRMQRAQQTQNFYKSLQLLQAGKMLRDENDDDENNAFEDYSIYMYRQQAPEFSSRVKDLEKKLLHPDRERGIYSSLPKGTPDEQFNDRIKSMEQRIAGRNQVTTDKKPKDLLRAIGKIESNDWNLRQIEKKIEESKKTEVGKSREKVPKWSKEQFLQRQNKLTRQDDQEVDERFKDIDQTIKHVEKQLKDGALRDVGERGKNKVASIAGNFIKKDEANTNSEEKLQKSSSKAALVFNTQKTTDICHFCKQKVYVMEKLATEGLVLHRNCLKCHHCHTSLRVGGYAFDRDDPEGKFYCTQHYRLPAKQMRAAIRKYPRPEAKEMTSSKNSSPYKTPEKPASRAESLKQIDLLDRGQTPERIEFENIDAMSDGEPSIGNIIDENEWTDRNFGTASEDSESDISSTDESSDSDSDIYEDVNGSPIEAQTLQLANEWIGKQRYTSNQYSDDDEFYASSEDDEADSQTEGEELEKARAIRMQEAKVKPVQYLPTDTETEAVSSQLKKMSEFRKDKSNSLESDYANRNEIKRIENTTDKGFSTEFDKLNESLYKINNFLKLSKDIEDLKKESLVKNDIQRKLSLKSQWLNSNHGSTASLNSLPPTNLKANQSGHGSTQSLNKGDTKKENELSKKRKNFANFKSQSVQNVNVESDNSRRTRRLGKRPTGSSFDELNFLDKLKLSDEDVSRLSQERDFQNTNEGLSKVDALKNQLRSQSESMGSSVNSSQRDLSKYFPKKEIKSKPINVNKNQKELKDVDLSKYFLPSPVQELKSLPSPGQSPKLPRKPSNLKSKDDNPTTTLLRTAIDNLQKFNKSESEDAQNEESSVFRAARENLQKIEKSKSDDNGDEPSFFRTARDNLQKVEPKKEDFTMRDQQLDGDVSLKKVPKLDKLNFNQTNKSEAPYSGYESIPLSGERDECEKLFDCMKSPVDNIDELFDRVAADALPKRKIIEKVPLKKQAPKIIRKLPEKKPIEIKKVELKSDFAPASKWCRKDSFKETNKREAEILGKLSSNLLNEIKLLEQHLQLNDSTPVNGKKEKEEKKIKKVKKGTKANEAETEFLGTEEELNNAIDDILNSVAYKEDIPENKPKKISHVSLPKASKGSKSIVNPFAYADAKTDEKVESNLDLKKVQPASEPTPNKRKTEKSEDTVDFACKPRTFEIEQKTQTKPILNRIPSTENEPVTYTLRKPSVAEIQPPSVKKQEHEIPKLQIIQSTPTVEKDVFTFTVRRTPSPVRETKPIQLESKPEPEPTASVNYSHRARSKERESSSSRKNSLKDDKKEIENRKAPRMPSRDRKASNGEIQQSIVKPAPQNERSDLVSFTVKKPPIGENGQAQRFEPKPGKIELTQKAPAKDNELVKVRQASFNEVSKVQLRENQIEIEPKKIKKPEIQSPLEMRRKQVTQRTPSRELEVVTRKPSLTETNKVQTSVANVSEPELNTVKIDKKDLMSFMIKKPLAETKSVQNSLDQKLPPNLEQSPDTNDARKTFFSNIDVPIKPERSDKRKDSIDNHVKFDERSSNDKTQNEPPVKPARRRKSSKSDDEQVNMRKKEPSPISSRKNSVSKKDEHKLQTNNLHKLASESNINEIPELNDIARILNAHNVRSENEIEVIELPASEPVESNHANKLDNGTEKLKGVQFKEYDDRRFDPPEYQEKCEHRWSGSGDYDNVPSTDNRQVKLDRNVSRSFDTACEMDREYCDYDNVIGRRSEERRPSPKISSLERKKNVTDMLLERSKNLHYKKQEFMNEKLETNPYIKRMIEKETRFRPAYERSRISPLASTSHYEYHQPYSHSISRPLPSSKTVSNSHLSYSPRATAPSASSSSSRGVLDMFRNPTSSTNKDSCNIS
ncbi:F-actin-monooxygenase Mical isoform X5 [Contarinia nasturtii]|uniref:F-actin-monooxygenase Mical isoform X5 n=1 Tax=Contarinia nasturtii TaxID=265458 RepID=UPI0012D41D8A|nr:F-actin-monooxygenase Mical isoform X5 [Contarinia nasturtii]